MENYFYLLIAGSRDFTDYNLLDIICILDELSVV